MMYWIYLFLFILIVFTPELIRDGILFLGQEELESILIFCFGILGLLLYLGKESALLKAVKEKIFLQRETNQIRKDLSHSYSYIGEMNRRFDIVKNSLVALPMTALRGFRRERRELYQPIFDAAALLTKSRHIRLLFVADTDGSTIEKYDLGNAFPPALTDGKRLLDTKKFFWEEGEYCIVRAPEDAYDTAAFLMFEKTANRSDDHEIFQILSAEALFLHSIDRRKLGLAPEEKKG